MNFKKLEGSDFDDGDIYRTYPAVNPAGNTSPMNTASNAEKPPAPPPRDLNRRSLTPPRRESSASMPRRSTAEETSVSRRESKVNAPMSPAQRRISLSPGVKYQKQSSDEKDDSSSFGVHGDVEAVGIQDPPPFTEINIAKPAEKSLKGSIGRIEKAEMGDNPKAEIFSRDFKGNRILQFAVWAHYMGYANTLLTITLGVFAILWTDAHTYRCKINGELINANYLPDTCNQSYLGNPICCDPDSMNHLTDSGNKSIGILYIIYGVFILLYEDTTYGYGLWVPADGFCYRYRISPIGFLHFAVGVVGLACNATALAGGCLISNGLVYMYSAYRYEAGDAGRAHRLKMLRQKKSSSTDNDTTTSSWSDSFHELMTWNPVTFYKRIYNEDKLSSYIWVALFIIANVLTYFITLNTWNGILEAIIDGLRNGNLKIDCNDALCKLNRKIVRYGPLSGFAPWAKAAGMCLNLNGSLILLPVIRNVLRKLNNSGVSFSNAKNQTDYFAKFFSHPLTRYIPLQKNIEFHKMCAGAILFFTYIHMICHYFNLITANAATLQFFRFAKWDGTQYLLGSMVVYSMFIIYTAAPEAVRTAKYEIFFNTHHMYIVFFLIMFLHGPIFIYWSIIPVALYILERYLQLYRGNRPYVVQKVEWIEPVLAVYFRPVFKEDFPFKEGQYLYLNCPAISASEWHPFTISSAHDDLHFGPRIHLETGEEVVEVPRSTAGGGRNSKYCVQSKDWRNLNPSEYLDKSETGYMDYVSVHIKVHGLNDPVARTWTRKLKEYFELLSPGKRFPYYFNRRDARGDISVGRQYGPDNKTQILRVDGPHSAPSEHYTNYGTVMLIGAGIGLTPCASILSALTR
jgi:hypothetical protein